MNTLVTGRKLSREMGEWRKQGPVYLALADRIRLLLLDGRLASGTRLPAERELSQALEISRTTVAAAYSRLREDGFLASTRGSGSTLLLPGRDRGFHTNHSGLSLDFSKATAPAFPGLLSAYSQAMEELPAYLGDDGFDMLGLPELREAIAQDYEKRGLPTSPEQIMVTIGAQHALNLVTRTIFSAGERILVEQPTYPHALDTFTQVGARLLSVPVTQENGWDIAEAVLQMRRAAPSMAYLMPDFQNPTGMSMPSIQREHIANAAQREGTVLVVDETTAMLDIDRGDMPPLAQFSPSVVTIGSLGKIAWGGLRIGWIRASRQFIDQCLRNRPAGDLGTPLFEQLVAKSLLLRMPELLASRTQELRSWRDFAVRLLATEMPEWKISVPNGGQSLWVNTGQTSSSALTLAARSLGLGLVPGPRFGIDGAFERFLRIPFCHDQEVMREAIAKLSQISQDVGHEFVRLPHEAVI